MNLDAAGPCLISFSRTRGAFSKLFLADKTKRQLLWRRGADSDSLSTPTFSPVALPGTASFFSTVLCVQAVLIFEPPGPSLSLRPGGA